MRIKHRVLYGVITRMINKLFNEYTALPTTCTLYNHICNEIVINIEVDNNIYVIKDNYIDIIKKYIHNNYKEYRRT